MRVIGGELRGRRLRTPRGDATRPTSSRAREALFGWLGERTVDADVLDLFAGSGALGIEALSRGARSAVFVERAHAALGSLRQNLDELGLRARARVIAAPVQRALAALRREGARFALVLADPPYRSTDLPDLAQRGQLAELLREDGVLIVERAVERAAGREVGREVGRDVEREVEREVERRGGRETGGVPEAGALWLRESRSYGRTAFDWYERRAAAEAAHAEQGDGE